MDGIYNVSNREHVVSNINSDIYLQLENCIYADPPVFNSIYSTNTIYNS